MSGRKKPPDVYVKVEAMRGLALVTGPKANEVAFKVTEQPEYSRYGRGWVIPNTLVPDVRSYCQWRGLLCVVSGEPPIPRVKPEPVFVAPEPEPEPPPPSHEQDDLF